MDGLVQEVAVEVVVDVLVTEAASGTARALVAPVVVVVGQVQVAKVLLAAGVAVADEGGLPVVVEVVPRDGDPVGRVVDIELAVLWLSVHLHDAVHRGRT